MISVLLAPKSTCCQPLYTSQLNSILIVVTRRRNTLNNKADACCSPKPLLEDRRLFSLEQAAGLAELFKLLADPTRVRLLQLLLKQGEMRVSDVSGALKMTPQAVSNQLQKLAYNNVVAARRAGVSIHYRVVDPCVRELLQQGICLLEDSRHNTQEEVI